jgi:hypothetical protein
MKCTIAGLSLFVCLYVTPRAFPQTKVWVTAKLDGYATRTNDEAFKSFFEEAKGAILLGLGDNLAMEYSSTHYGSGENKGAAISRVGFQKQPLPDDQQLPAARYLQQRTYTAMTPGARDFYFGAAWLYLIGNGAQDTPNPRRLDIVKLPLLGANLVVCSPPQNPQTVPQSQVQILLPTEASLPGALATPGGQAGGNGSGGKGKGGGAGGSGQGGGAAPPGSSTTTAVSPTVGCNVSQSLPEGNPVQLSYPSRNAIYPWSTQLGFGGPDGLKISKCTIEMGGQTRQCPAITTTRNGFSVNLRTFMAVCRDGTLLRGPHDNCPNPNSMPDSSPILYPGAAGEIDLVYSLKSDSGPYRQTIPIQVQSPFFDHIWKCATSDAKCGDAKQSVIFAVVSPSLQDQIPQTNRELCLGDPCISAVRRSSVAFNEATSALVQATRAYECLNHRSGKDCTNASSGHSAPDQDIYYVLAQMAPDEAFAFARSLTVRFANFSQNLVHLWDIVLSAGEAYSYTRDGSQTFDTSDEPRTIPVITPRPLLLPAPEQTGFKPRSDPQSLRMVDPLASITISDAPGSHQRTVAYKTGGIGAPECHSLAAYLGSPTDSSPSRQFMSPKWKAANSTEAETGFLRIMARYMNADIALMQGHDLYLGCYLSGDPPKDTHELIERVLPEAGYITRVSLLGSTLQSVLAANQSILDQSPSSTEPMAAEQNRALLMYGVTTGVIDRPRASELELVDPQQTYYIDGAPLNQTKVYSIATTEALATAEPIFPQLAQQDIEAPVTFFGVKGAGSAHRVADVVLAGLAPPHKPSAGSLYAEVVGNVGTAPQSLPGGNGKDKGSSNEFARLGDGFTGFFAAPFVDVATASRNPLEPKFLKAPQQYPQENRPYWSATVQQLSGSFAYTHPNLSDAGIGTDFSGVTNPNVISAHSDSLTLASNGRVLYSPDRPFAFGIDEIGGYSKMRTGSTTSAPPAVVSDFTPLPSGTTLLSANTVIASPFAQLQTFRAQPHWILPTVRLLVNHDIARTLQYLKSGWSIPSLSGTSGAATEPVYFLFAPKPQWGWGGAIGPRFEFSNLSYIEIGYLRQYSMNILNGIGVDNLNSGQPVLPIQLLRANQSPAAILAYKVCSTSIPQPCLNNPAQGAFLTYQYNEVRQNGFYSLEFWTFSLPGIHQITNQQVLYGDWFAPGNPASRSSTETRYGANLSESIQYNFWSNLSFGPQYAMFFYQDQSTSRPSSLTRQQLSVQLNYTFDWHSGLSPRVLLGKSE